MRFYGSDTYYAYPNHGYRSPEELDAHIDETFKALSAKYHVPTPRWGWTAINTHFEPLEQFILISDYVVDIYNARPEYKEDIRRLVGWEAAHEFKHYLDNYRFLTGDPHGRKVIRHVERRRLLKMWFDLHGTVPEFEENAVMFATMATKINENEYNRLYGRIQPWNIPGYRIPGT